MRKIHIEKNVSDLVRILFGFYIILLLLISFVGVSIQAPIRLYENYADVSNNFVPFHSIRTYLFNPNQFNFTTWFYNTFGNVLSFLPFGIFVPLVFAKMRRIAQMVIFSFAASLAIETLQYVTILGVFDVDDIILNILGSVLGYIILISIVKTNRNSLFN